MTDKEEIIDGADVKGCIFYIDYNPPEGSGTWGGAIHKGACKLNSTDCKHTPQCFIKRLYKQLKRKEQEYNEYKDKVEYIHTFLRDPHNYGSFKPMWGSFLLRWLFNEDLGDFFSEEAYEMTDTIAEKEKQIINYEQALEEIEQTINNFPSIGIQDVPQTRIEYTEYLLSVSKTKLRKVLDIIDEVKGQCYG